MNDKKKEFYKMVEAAGELPSSVMAIRCTCKMPGLNLHTMCLSPMRALCNCECHKEEEDE